MTSGGGLIVPTRTERRYLLWAAIVCVLLIALAGTSLAYLHAQSAMNCTNNALGPRSNVGQPDEVLNHVLATPQHPRKAGEPVTDSDANRAVYRELVTIQHGPAPAPAGTRVVFYRVIQHALDVLDANQQYRLAHPLGQCG